MVVMGLIERAAGGRLVLTRQGRGSTQAEDALIDVNTPRFDI
jgi:hypothetical protein